jgi:REP element-mobilizing transposase RayT
MKYDPERHARHSIRLKGFDYAQPGAYFVTLCVRNRECLLGDTVGPSVGTHGGAPASDDRDGMARLELSAYGRIVADGWYRSAEIRREIELDVFVVMPNHIHGIVLIHEGRAHRRAPLPSDRNHRKPRSLGSFLAGFKNATTTQINILRGTPGMSFWQRNYYERIIRDETELNYIRQYIINNPMQWEMDRENPDYR